MYFDVYDFAAFDIHILKRAGATERFDADIASEASRRFAGMDENTQKALVNNIVFGLPGSAGSFTLEDVRHHLAEYDHISLERLFANFSAFLETR